LFAGFGAVQDAMDVEQGHHGRLVFAMMMNALSAVMWALFGSMRMIKSLIVLAVIQFTLVLFVAKRWPSQPQVLAIDQLRQELLKHDGIVMIFILVGYLLLIQFFRMEGKRFFAAHTEIRLASEIQRELVPRSPKKPAISSFMVSLCQAALSAATSRMWLPLEISFALIWPTSWDMVFPPVC
jgi:hypothetical protein